MLVSAEQFINLVNHTINLESIQSISVVIQSRDNLRRRYSEDRGIEDIFDIEFNYLGLNDKIQEMIDSIIDRIPKDYRNDRFDCLVKFYLGREMNLEIIIGDNIKLSSIKRTTNKINVINYY